MLNFRFPIPQPSAPAAAPAPSVGPGDAAPEAASAPPLQVIVFASQKGGSGKTTLCGQLAVQAERAGLGPVALIDTDPQGSLAGWWNAREAQTPVFVRTDFARLSRDLEELRRQGIRLVFVDTPPAVSETMREVVGYADLVVVPTRPSPHDLRSVGATLDIIDGVGKPLVFAVNAATARARITRDTAVALSQHGTVAPATVHQRVDFATSMIDGRAVMELDPQSRSAGEIEELWRYIESRLAKLAGRRTRPSVAALRGTPSDHAPGVRPLPQTPVFGRRRGDGRPA